MIIGKDYYDENSGKGKMRKKEIVEKSSERKMGIGEDKVKRKRRRSGRRIVVVEKKDKEKIKNRKKEEKEEEDE